MLLGLTDHRRTIAPTHRTGPTRKGLAGQGRHHPLSALTQHQAGGAPAWLIQLRFVPARIAPRGAVGKAAGTAFLYGRPSDRSTDGHFVYLVTARHNITKTEHLGNLHLRANLKSGGAEFVELDGQWYYPENEASDIAVMPVGPGAEFDIGSMGSDLVVTDEVARRYGLGVGDEVFSVGLFTPHRGKTRNVPLVRTGTVAAMPGEPLEEPTSGIEFLAYPVEMRSIGGLSGSPVYVYFSIDRLLSGEAQPYSRTSIFLLGLIRGHWSKPGPWLSDFELSETDTINTGIAVVTPIQEVVDLIEGDEDLKRKRREIDRREMESRQETEGSE